MTEPRVSTGRWAVDTVERVIGTAAATAAGLLVSTDDRPLDLVAIDFEHGAGVVAVISLLTLLKCVAARFKGRKDSASFVDSV